MLDFHQFDDGRTRMPVNIDDSFDVCVKAAVFTLHPYLSNVERQILSNLFPPNEINLKPFDTPVSIRI